MRIMEFLDGDNVEIMLIVVTNWKPLDCIVFMREHNE